MAYIKIPTRYNNEIIDAADTNQLMINEEEIINGTKAFTHLATDDTSLVTNLNADMVDSAHKSIDGTLASNSDALIPSEKAVKTYVGTSIITNHNSLTGKQGGPVEFFHLTSTGYNNSHSPYIIGTKTISETGIANDKVVTYNTSTGTLIYTNKLNYYLDTSIIPNTITITPSPIYTSYTTGMSFSIKLANTNTGTTTIDANGLGAVTVKKNVSDNLTSGDIKVGQILTVCYDGSYFQLTGSGSGSGSGTGITFANDTSTTANYIIVSPIGVTSYSEGLSLDIKVAKTNTSTGVVINVNSLGNKYIKKSINTTTGLIDLSIGDIIDNSIIQLVYDTSTGCFQIIGGLVNKYGNQYDYTFTTSTGLIYNIPYIMSSKEDILVSVNGVILYPADYSVSGNSLTFTLGTIAAGDLIYLKIKEIFVNSMTINPVNYSFTTSTGLSYTLGFTPISKSALIITCNGQVLHPNDYSLSNATLTFTAGVTESGDEIVVYNTTSTKELQGVFGRISDYTFTTTSSLSYTLPYTPISKSSMLVIDNGTVIHPNDYALVADTITFNANIITNGDPILVKIIDPVITVTQFDDAPSDGQAYVRKNQTWILLSTYL